jgi:hypothetical protein
MTDAARTIHVEPGSELDRLLEQVEEEPVEIERGGRRFRVTLREIRSEELDTGTSDLWEGYNPETAMAGILAAAGAWSDIDAEALKKMLRQAREAGSRPANRP